MRMNVRQLSLAVRVVSAKNVDSNKKILTIFVAFGHKKTVTNDFVIIVGPF